MVYLVSCKLRNRLEKETVLVTLTIQQGTVSKLSPKYSEIYRQGCIWINWFFCQIFCILLHEASVAFLTSLHVEVCNIRWSFLIITGEAFKVICHLPSLLSCLSTASSEKDQWYKTAIPFFSPLIQWTDLPKLAVTFHARKFRLKKTFAMSPPQMFHYVAASNKGKKSETI